MILDRNHNLAAEEALPWQTPGDFRITLPPGLQPAAPYFHRVNVGGLWIDNVTMAEAISLIDRLIRRRTPSYIVTPNVDHVVRVHRDARFRRVYREAALSLADGMPLLWAARLLGRPLRAKVSGSDLLPRFCESAARKGHRVFFMGGLPGAAELAAESLKRQYPGLQIVGTCCPPYGFEKDPEQNQRVIRTIREANADVLFVGLGSPKQEIWIHRYCGEYAVPVSVGVGASLDFCAGLVRRAPRPVQVVGAEWLWRLAMEPRRLYRRYLIEDPIFFNMIWRQLRADRYPRGPSQKARQRRRQAIGAGQVLHVEPAEPVVDSPAVPDDTADSFKALAPLCVKRLGESLDPATGLLRRQFRDRQWAPTLAVEDLTSTASCLIALNLAGIDPRTIGMDVQRSLRSLIDYVAHRRCHSSAGLVVWANAVCGGIPLAQLAARWETTLEELPDIVGPCRTMEGAWMVGGLAHELMRSNRAIIADALRRATGQLLRRYSPATRFFYHSTTAAPLNRWLRRPIASFADQMEAVQALSLAAMATGESRPLRAADACAARLVQLQGPLGQWWWHYDPRDGGIADAYPVFSSHQYALAPMALTALRAAGGSDHATAVARGRRWLMHNELRTPLIDLEAGTIWRSIDAPASILSRWAHHGWVLTGWKRRRLPAAPQALRVNYETRPYEWAWCLYAAAMQRDCPRQRLQPA